MHAMLRAVSCLTSGRFGRAKKNWKTSDAMLAAFHAVMQDSPWGSQVYVLANDEDQAKVALDLAKKLVGANALLNDWLSIKQRTIERETAVALSRCCRQRMPSAHTGKHIGSCDSTKSTAIATGICWRHRA